MLFQQLVNRMCSHCLFPACWKVVNGLLTTCYKVVELNRLVTSCSNNLISTICQQVVWQNAGRKNEKGDFESGWEKHIWKNIVTSAKKICVYKLINRLSDILNYRLFCLTVFANFLLHGSHKIVHIETWSVITCNVSLPEYILVRFQSDHENYALFCWYYALYLLHESRVRRKLDSYDNVRLCSCLCKKHYDSWVM
jgi:hypothetical protein